MPLGPPLVIVDKTQRSLRLAGCIGLRIPQLDQVYPKVSLGTPVRINP